MRTHLGHYAKVLELRSLERDALAQAHAYACHFARKPHQDFSS